MGHRARCIQIAALCVAGATSAARAEDRGFRYEGGRCVNGQGVEGHNPRFLGPCGELSGAVLGRIDLSGIDLSGALLDGVDFRLSTLVGAKLLGAKLDGANLTGVDFAESDFSGASLQEAILKRAKAFRAVFRNARLERAQAQMLDAGEADFSEATLSEARFDEAVISGGKMRGAMATGTNLRKVQLDGVDMTGTSVAGADLRNANLADATVDGMTWTGAMISRRTVLPLTAEEIAQLGVTTRELLLEFSGIKRNVEPSTLEGWRICHTSLYNATPSVQSAFDGCPGEKLMFACRRTGTTSLITAAYGPRASVMTDVGTNSNGATEVNGVRFYYSNTYSIGFGPMGQLLSRNSCDTQNTVGEDRLCWHTTGGNFQGGYRCGVTTGLNGSNQYERVILVPED